MRLPPRSEGASLVVAARRATGASVLDSADARFGGPGGPSARRGAGERGLGTMLGFARAATRRRVRPDARLAGYAVPARRDVGRRGRQLRALLRARDRRRAVPVRRARGRRVESTPIELPERTDLTSGTCYLPDVRPGQLYGYRVHGPYEPGAGPSLQPEQAADRPVREGDQRRRSSWDDDALRLHDRRTPTPTSRATTATAPARMPKCVVVDPAFTWGDDRPPRTPWNRTVIYECHVRGMTMLHPRVPEELRGTYLGLASDPILDHLTVARRDRGRAACRCTSSWTTATCVEQGPRPTTGATTRSASSPPTSRYATARPRPAGAASSSRWSRRCTGPGIEVILDVVYNHTAEGNHLGPTLSLRGIDNADVLPAHARRPALLHRLHRHRQQPEHAAPADVQLIMDSLRYWVTDMHVDGFRFDLAPVLARELYEVNRLGAFFDIIQQDPVLSPGQADRRAVGRRARTATRSATSRSAGRSGTASTATACAASGGATPGSCPSSRRASPGRATSTRRAGGAPTRASTSSPATTASR